MAALGAALLLLLTGGLRSEVAEYLSHQSRQGLQLQSVQLLEVEMLTPCTLAVPPFRKGLEGYLAAFGGNYTLDLWISISDSSWSLADSMPDDVPVLELDGKQLMEADHIVVEALDMTHGAGSDSAAVMWLLRSVDPSSS